MKILGLTSIRSDYDLMSKLFIILSKDPEIDFRLLVSGAHLSPIHGMTVNEIKEDGLQILIEIESLINADTLSSRLKTASNLLISAIDPVRVFSPDLIIYAGDREDVMIGALLGGFLNIPTLHLFGGDHATDGHIDNPVRHAVSKLSSVHFVSIPQHRDRLRALGEPEYRIHVIGSIALDKFIEEPLLSKSHVLSYIGVPTKFHEKLVALVIFHPIYEEISEAGNYILNIVDALIEKQFYVCIGYPNTDPGYHNLHQTLKKIADNPNVTIYNNIPRREFISLFKHCSLIAGNSSAGIAEAASIPIPVINVGRRQKSRFAGENVVFCDGDRNSIDHALQLVLSKEFQEHTKKMKNPYGDGDSSKAAYELIKKIDFSSLLKKPEDPLLEVLRYA